MLTQSHDETLAKRAYFMSAANGVSNLFSDCCSQILARSTDHNFVRLSILPLQIMQNDCVYCTIVYIFNYVE